MKEPLSYNDWFCVTRPRVHSPYLDLDTEVELAEPLTELFIYITAERLTDERVERFCSGFLQFLDALYTTAEAFTDETLAKAPHYWRLGPGKQRFSAYSITNKITQIISREVFPRKRSLAKSPIFYRMVRQIIGDERVGEGRFWFIMKILPATGRSDGVDFASLIQDSFLAPACFEALRRMKDWRFVREAQALLDDPKTVRRVDMKRYLERFAESQIAESQN